MANHETSSKPGSAKRARTDVSSTLLAGSSNGALGANGALQQTDPTNVKGKQMAMAFNFFQELPADVLGEIVSYLEPVDLLHLARATRELRSFLMSSSSVVFWKRARQNIADLPSCPKDLSEPAYAHLLFSNMCHKCLANDRDVLLHLEARTQLCEPCTLEEFKRWKELPEEVDTALAELVPDTTQELTAKEKKQSDQNRRDPEYLKVARTRFHVKTAMRLHKRCGGLRGAEKSSWLQDQQIALAELEAHTKLCRSYVNNQRWKGRERIWMAEMTRMNQIKDKLTALGYGDDFSQRADFREGDFTRMAPLIYQDHELTDEEWDEMRDDLIQWMQNIREAREWQNRLRKMRQRVDSSLGGAYTTFALSQPAGAIMPTLAEVALMEDVAQVLGTVPLDEDMPDGSLDSVIVKIPKLVEEWRVQLENSLLDLLRQSVAYGDHPDLTKDVLSYASTLFTCKNCVEVLTYPGIFMHPCFSTSIGAIDPRSIAPGNRMKKYRPVVPLPTPSTNREGTSSGALTQATFHTPYNLSSYLIWLPENRLRFDEAMHYHTVSILDQLGMPRITTAATFLNINPYVEGICQCFNTRSKKDGSSPRKATRWLHALLHCRRHRSRNYAASFNVFPNVQLQGLRGYSAALPTPGRQHCFWCGINTWDMTLHLTNWHDMPQAQAVAASQLSPYEKYHYDCTVQIAIDA